MRRPPGYHAQARGPYTRQTRYEIRQPLGVLQVLARVLTHRDADPETARLVETLERNVVRLREVAGKLERLSRLTRRMEAMGGSVTVESVEGMGTTFTLEWPGMTVRKKPATV